MTITFTVHGTPITQGSKRAISINGKARADWDVALTRLRALIEDHDPTEIQFFAHAGPPVSKARARWSAKSGRFYTPGSTSTAQDAMTAAFLGVTHGRTMEGAVAIVLGFYRPNFQRIDIDNLTKLVMDAATKAGVWRDDSQVVAQTCFIEFDADNPRTIIAYCQIPSSMDRSRRFICTICGKQFSRAGVAAVKHPPRFCSRECRAEGYRRDRAEVRCARCGVVFRRRRAAQRYCSRACASADPLRRPPNRELRPKPTCQQCGGPVSRREYLRCANCSPKGRKPGSKNRVKAPVWQVTE